MNTQTASIKPSLAVVDGKKASLSEILEILNRDGGVIVHNMLTPEVVARMLEELKQTTTTAQVGPKTSHELVNYFWGELPKMARQGSYLVVTSGQTSHAKPPKTKSRKQSCLSAAA